MKERNDSSERVSLTKRKKERERELESYIRTQEAGEGNKETTKNGTIEGG